MMGRNFEKRKNRRTNIATPETVRDHSTQVAEYETNSGLKSWIGNNGASKVGIIIRYLLIQRADTDIKAANAMELIFLNLGTAIIIIGSVTPRKAE